jgi:hypothetical protein
LAAGTQFLDCDVGLFKGEKIDIDPVPQLPFAGGATDAVLISGSKSSAKSNIGRSSVLLLTTSRDGRWCTQFLPKLPRQDLKTKFYIPYILYYI